MDILESTNLNPESLMSSLMSHVTGKLEGTHLFPSSHHGAAGLVSEECWRSDTAAEVPEPERIQEQNAATESEVPSYVPLYGSEGYVSSPTYIRGDYYDISPPSSPTLCFPAVSRPQGKLSFSIDAILGTPVGDSEPRDISRDSVPEVAAQVCSAFLEQGLCYSSDYGLGISSGNDSERAMNKLYWCHVCELFCPGIVEAQRHQNHHFAQQEPCQLQQDIFRSRGYITEHAQTSSQYRLVCGLCDKIVMYRFFKRHLKVHESHRCSVCNREFLNEHLLQDHMNSHYGYTPYSCDVCNQQFSSRRCLKVHLRRYKQATHQCSTCSKAFSTRSACVRHEKIHHRASGPFVCSIFGCQKSFDKEVSLRLHLSWHRR